MVFPCLKLSNIRYVSRVKWGNPGKGVAPSPTLRCSSYRKGNLLVALDYGRQLLLYSCFDIVLIALFWAAIRRDSVSLSRFPFICHVQVFSCEISHVCRLKCLYSCFSSHFCFLVIFVLFILALSVISFHRQFFMYSSSRCVDAILIPGKSSFSFFFRLI